MVISSNLSLQHDLQQQQQQPPDVNQNSVCFTMNHNQINNNNNQQKSSTEKYQLESGLTRDQLHYQNQNLRNQIETCLEFKRIIEHIFHDNKTLLQSQAFQPYVPHTVSTMKKFKYYQHCFNDHLSSNISDLRKVELSCCGNSDCKLSDCRKANVAEVFENNQSMIEEEMVISRSDFNIEKHQQPQPLDSPRPQQSYTPPKSTIQEPQKLSNTTTSMPETTMSNSNNNRENKAFIKHKATNTISLSSLSTAAVTSTTSNSSTTTIPAKSENKNNIIVMVDGIPKFKCRVEDCNILMNNEDETFNHMVQHQKLFKCSVCEALFTEKHLVYKHFSVHK